LLTLLPFPDRGQGGNIAFCDSDNFVTAMVSVQKGEKSLKEAIDEYDKGVMARGAEVEISRTQTMAFHDYAKFMESPLMKLGIKPAKAE